MKQGSGWSDVRRIDSNSPMMPPTCQGITMGGGAVGIHMVKLLGLSHGRAMDIAGKFLFAGQDPETHLGIHKL